MTPPRVRRWPGGRLFWKFFLIFWSAQVLTSAGVGIAIWALRPEFPERPPPRLEGPFEGRFDNRARPDFPRDAAPPNRPAPPHQPHPPRPPRPWQPPLLPLIAGGAVSLVFAALLAAYFARPIRRLKDAFDDVAAGRLTTRIGHGMDNRRDELADLGQDFDRMADRLQALLDSQRRLLHDVSHELRSPLARLQAAVELMRQQPDRAGELVERVERDCGRIDTLVGELLTLARLDAAESRPLASEMIDLADILAALADDAEFEASGDAGPARIATDFASPLPVRGDRELLHRAFDNVVRNAVRHARSPASGAIQIAARRQEIDGKGWIVVDIADDGPGLKEEELPRIFDPFFRGSSAARGSGHGLGLAITQRVVIAHGGRIAARNRPQGGLAVCIDLPAAL
jgi:signal transduction histidine kinase